ncbi:MAG TPA: sugar ABC transporter ATP-binding protein [Clostridiaceae bacterium]|nr:sugar ABC transporter ATP-binding protein [Clostridiaceae bacterium]
MELRENEILAVIGENGAGKSTLMKILSGIYSSKEYEGNIYVNNKLCQFRNPHDSENAGIAMIYQELNLELDLTVAENILLGRYPRTKLGFVDWKKMRKMAKEVLERLHANIDVNATVRSLSPSMQQLVCIARALLRNPKILILDEPTSVLTENETKVFMNLLHEMKEQGISCIYISHKLDEVFQLCDRVIVLRDGQLICEYEKKHGYDSKSIINSMIGRRLDVMYPQIEKKEDDTELLRIENFRVPHTSAYGKSIIKDVSFSIKKGEILGLAGLVGSGRSELVNAIFGLLPKTSGRIYMEGREAKINNPEDAIKLGIGLLTEDRKKNGYVWSMSIEHNMTLAILRELRKGIFIDSKKEQEIAKEYFTKLNVKAPGIKTLITSLSGGNQQKVILARWLMTKLKLLILDEPTRGIDVGTKAEIYKLMVDLSKSGISILMISSELPELLAMCDRFIVLGKGVVQAELERGEANEVNIMQAASNT